MRLLIIMAMMLLLISCQGVSDNTGNKQFLTRTDAEIYAKVMRFHGYRAVVRHYNWYNLGGYAWDVEVTNDISSSESIKNKESK